MTLPLDNSSLNQAPAGRHPESDSPAFAETQRRVEEVVANRVRERSIKDELRRAFYQRAVDDGLRRFNGTAQPSRLKAAGRVAVCGFAAFMVVLWALGPATLDTIGALAVAAGASICLGILSLAIAAICDRAGGRHSDPADPHPMPRRKDEKALRRLF
ncbi:MAG: hypothetical protein HYU58_10725 [Proteobacteria bacterium]|nr:hypothetical protein [Pseudomonadota bacterium]